VSNRQADAAILAATVSPVSPMSSIVRTSGLWSSVGAAIGLLMAWTAALRTSIRTCEYRFFIRCDTWPAIASAVSSDTSGFSSSLVIAVCLLCRARHNRHTFGSLLIQGGASIVYVKEQMGHSSIQVTVDIYGHLIPGANVSFVDSLDLVPEEPEKTTPQQNATQAQLPENCEPGIPAEVAELIGGGGWTRTNDLRIMRPSL
jgi:hypothetical protein